MQKSQPLVLRGKAISEDANGHICLDDLWLLSGAKNSKAPTRWRATQAAKSLTQQLSKNIAISSIKENKPNIPVVYSLKGRGNAGTFAHPILAAAYAGYLSPKLEIEIREIWLRYRAGDASLADEILQRASAEDNEKAAIRALGRATRTRYTSMLKLHGVSAPVDFAICTNETYHALFDGSAKEIKKGLGLPQKANLRDSLESKDLAYLMAAEALATERIDDTDCQGTPQCRSATRSSAKFIREAIERDRADRHRQTRMDV